MFVPKVLKRSDIGTLLRWLHNKSRPYKYLQEFADPAEESRTIYRHRLEHITPVRQTVILISQVQRSGGTLMSQLFDGHHQLHAHPHELSIGYPKKWNYPDLELTETPETWFRLLFEKPILNNLRKGYYKLPNYADVDNPDVFPFLLLPNLQREVFLRCVSEWLPQNRSQRTVLDSYMTSYFNAWVDYQGLYQQKLFVTAFVPRMSMYKENMERYMRDYPGAKLIQVIRDPKGWYVSAHRHSAKDYPNPQEAMPLWVDSATSVLRNKKDYPERVFVVTFDTLLKKTEDVMRMMADWLGIEWNDLLTEPTFQGQPIKANTGYSTNQYGVIREPLERHKALNSDDAGLIESLVGDLYQKVLDISDI